MAKLKVVHKWVGLGRVQSFMLIPGRIGLGHFTCESGWVGSRKLDQRPTLQQTSQHRNKHNDDLKTLLGSSK